jgi:transposase
MERLIERAAGLDVHKDSVSVCVRVPGRGRGGRRQERASFRTTTGGLLALRDWLAGWGVTDVAMEATGVYWKPVWYVLEDEFALLLCNAQHVKRVPGRKTDVSDAQWLAQLLEHGLLRASFVPPQPIRELRDLTRYRKTLVQERTREGQRLDKVLQDAGIKLSSVASDLLGVSARAMLQALVAGDRDPEALAQLAKTQLRRKLPALREALSGRFSGHHALLVSEILAHIEYLEQAIERLSGEIEAKIAPFAPEIELLTTIPGVERTTAEVVLAEIGPDMSRFADHRQLASWAKLCPGSNESAGKQRSGRTGKGPVWLRAALIQSAKAASRTRGTYLSAQYARLRGRRGHEKATIAVAHSILVSIYYVLARHQPYNELGETFFLERQNIDAYRRRLIRQLERLGHQVILQPLPDAA